MLQKGVLDSRERAGSSYWLVRSTNIHGVTF
jgi:hypothetical protein